MFPIIIKRHILHILFYAVLSVVFCSLSSCSRIGTPENDVEIFREFMELRNSGNNGAAYGMLSDSTRAVFSEEMFNNYCFVYRVIEFEIFKESSGYVRSVYNFYDKKYKKDSDELYTFYISSNTETVRIREGKILFPHIGFIEIRKNIEERKMDELKETLRKMINIDPENPEVNQTAGKMELLSGSEE
ncbi:MAG TPA: hypothetical protein VLJ60_08310 [bacterium]|nr:hypothetical protein [bacterium]